MAFSFNPSSFSQPAASSSNPFSFNSNANPSTSTSKQPFSFGQSNPSSSSSSPAQFSLFQNQNAQNPQNPPQTSLFASSTKPAPLTVSQLLGAPPSNALANSGNTQSLSSNQLSSSSSSLEDRIMNIKNAWDPSSPTNRFCFYLYNLSPTGPLSIPLTSLPLPPNVASSPHLTQLYKQAVLENPRPTTFVPALATSMDDLKRRNDAQKHMANLHLGKLHSPEVMSKIRDANKKHWSETVVRIERLNREQVHLEVRLVRICAKLAGIPVHAQVQVGSGAGGTGQDDADLLLVLERISAELDGAPHLAHRPAGSGYRQKPLTGTPRLAGIVNELWMVVSQRKAVIHASNQSSAAGTSRSGTPDGSSSAQAEYGIVDEGELNKVLEVLAQQQKSLDYLSTTIRSLATDIDTCRIGFGLSPLSESTEHGQGQRERAAMLLG
ncbi:MAG: hypothetical protein CYPHOPRED_004298 [Cyphobasidiales sp. Tagirdzhanova-0007]|nr:MAG: hypothetical protein CYPHOPRED_004298 [Cyphobasidiales sp. Tagirdzhanova-0007]